MSGRDRLGPGAALAGEQQLGVVVDAAVGIGDEEVDGGARGHGGCW